MEKKKEEVRTSQKRKNIGIELPESFYKCNKKGCLESLLAENSIEDIYLLMRDFSSIEMISYGHTKCVLVREYAEAIVENNIWRNSYSSVWKYLISGSIVGWIVGYGLWQTMGDVVSQIINMPWFIGGVGIIFQAITVGGYAVYMRLRNVEKDISDDDTWAREIVDEILKARDDGRFASSLTENINKKEMVNRIIMQRKIKEDMIVKRTQKEDENRAKKK